MQDKKYGLLSCYQQNADIAKLLVDNFRDQININLQDKEYGFTPLHNACGQNTDC